MYERVLRRSEPGAALLAPVSQRLRVAARDDTLWRCTALALLALALPTLGTAQTRTDCLLCTPSATSPCKLHDAASAQAIRPQLACASEIRVWKTIALGEYNGVNAVRRALDN